MTAKVVRRLSNPVDFELRILDLEVLLDATSHFSSRKFCSRFEIEVATKDVSFNFTEIGECQHDCPLVWLEDLIHLGNIPFVCPDSTESGKKLLITVRKREFDDAVFSKAPEHPLG